MIEESEEFEGNKLITKFVGFEVEELGGNRYKVIFNNRILYDGFKTLETLQNPTDYFLNNLCNPKNSEGFRYGLSWTWLMDLVYIIKNKGYRFYLESNEESNKVRFTDMAIPGNIIVNNESNNEELNVLLYRSIVSIIKYINEL